MAEVLPLAERIRDGRLPAIRQGELLWLPPRELTRGDVELLRKAAPDLKLAD